MKCSHCAGRREFLKTGVKTICGASLVAALPSFLGACNQAPLTTETGPSTTIPGSANGIYTFNFTDYPALQTPGGSILVTINAASGPKSVYITRVDSATVDTVSSICTHAGCQINAYNSATQQYDCPCHGSIFTASGAVIQGPAVTPLPSYPSVLTGTGIEVTVL